MLRSTKYLLEGKKNKIIQKPTVLSDEKAQYCEGYNSTQTDVC